MGYYKVYASGWWAVGAPFAGNDPPFADSRET
jgi:hypothetical protein